MMSVVVLLGRMLEPKGGKLYGGDWRLVWFSGHIPRHAFMNNWLIIQNQITLNEKMSKWGFIKDLLCPFCCIRIESRKQLFYCFSSAILRRCFYARRVGCRKAEVQWATDKLNGSEFKSTIARNNH